VGPAPADHILTRHAQQLLHRLPQQKSAWQQYVPDARATLLSVAVPGERGHDFVFVMGPKMTQEPFGSEEVRTIEAIAGQLATIVDKLELVDELRRKSEELQELNRMLVEANEAERARIAAHLHDDPLQKITYVLWLCQDHNVPSEVVTYLHDVVSDLRNFTALLRPVELQDLGLARALEALVDEVQARSSFSADLRVTGLSRDGRLPDEIELGVYRIVQEALNNCQKHAQATNVWVRVAVRDSNAQVSIEDDGRGLAPINGDRRPRMGIPGMRQRAEQLGGRLTIGPRKPCGTSVRAEIPVPATEPLPEGPMLLGANHD
jgi:two-component system sensor histidine kinase DegS